MTAVALLHTLVSVLPVDIGLAAYARRGAIDPKTRLGKWYGCGCSSPPRR